MLGVTAGSQPTDRYLMDTSSLVEIERGERSAAERDDVWRMVVDLLVVERVRLLDIVWEELHRNADGEYFDRVLRRLRGYNRARFKLAAKPSLTPMDLQHLADITTRYPKMSGIGALGERADPYLVCLGRAGGYTVVTEESQIVDDRIPAACRYYDVECINLAQMIEREMGES